MGDAGRHDAERITQRIGAQDLNRGFLASIATGRPPIVGPLAAFLHALDQRLRALCLAYRVPLLNSAASLVLSLGLFEQYRRYFRHTLPSA